MTYSRFKFKLVNFTKYGKDLTARTAIKKIKYKYSSKKFRLITLQIVLLELIIRNKGLKANEPNTAYIKTIQKSPESTNSIPNFSETKNPIKPASKAADPPDTISQAGLREYLSFVYNRSFFKKFTSNNVKSKLWGLELLSKDRDLEIVGTLRGVDGKAVLPLDDLK